jgi:hypothetical protein
VQAVADGAAVIAVRQFGISAARPGPDPAMVSRLPTETSVGVSIMPSSARDRR